MTGTPNVNAKHIHHGRTAAAWTGVAITGVAFIVGAIALIAGPIWIMFWIAVGLVAIALIATRILQVLGHGAY